MKNNNDYKSFLGTEFKKFLNWRKDMGCIDHKHKYLFNQFDSYLIENNCRAEDISPELFINFRNTLNCEAKTINMKMGILRMFFDYLNRIDSTVENPLQYISALPEKRFIPFVFSEDEIKILLKTIYDDQIKKTESTFLTDLSIYVSIVLMAHCGLRISEPLRLKVKHYRSDEKTLYIEKTKFKKDRLIPLPMNAYSEINNHFEVLKSYGLDSKDSYLLVDQKRGHLVKSDIYSSYYKALARIGLLHDKKTLKGNMSFGKSTPHSLRHSFAVNTLKRIKQRGKSPQNALPALAQYLGHEKYENTEVYLKVLDANHRKSMVDFYMSDFKENIKK